MPPPRADDPRGRLRPLAKVLPEDVRRNNRALVLQQLFPDRQLSRADIARQTGLTRVTVSDLVGELGADDLVEEMGIREQSRPGKPATLLRIKPDGRSIIVVDLADAQRFHGAVLDLTGRVLARAERRLNGAGGSPALRLVHELVSDLVALAEHPILGVGIGSPGVVDRAGTVLSAVNLGWTDLPLQQHLADELGLPVVVANDANLAALAESSADTSEGADGFDSDMILVQIGRGVGAGLIIEGSLVRGSSFSAGEIGHVCVTDPAAAADQPVENLESWVAAPQLTRRLERGRDDPAAVLTAAGARLGLVLTPIVAALNLHRIVLSGPVDLLDHAFQQSVIDTVRARTVARLTGPVGLRVSALGEDIVLLGAASLVRLGQLGVS